LAALLHDLGKASLVEPYWTFDHGLPVTSVLWRKRAARLARRLLDRLPSMCDGGWLSAPYVMHVARLSLMLADYHYSGLTEQPPRLCGEDNYPLHATTRREAGEANQSFDEYLLGVEKHASSMPRSRTPISKQSMSRLCPRMPIR